jgi:[CysO sulfur-carrier protein]-S-L-cysteine hydrolase
MAVLIPSQAREAMVNHALWCLPEEACGLMAADSRGVIRMVYPLSNADASPTAYTIEPIEHFRALQHAERNGWELIGTFHSHPSTEAYPSATDIARAAEPDWLYIVIGLKSVPEVRCFRIRDRRVTEEQIRYTPG